MSNSRSENVFSFLYLKCLQEDNGASLVIKSCYHRLQIMVSPVSRMLREKLRKTHREMGLINRDTWRCFKIK